LAAGGDRRCHGQHLADFPRQPVRVEGAADWLDAARLPCDPEAALAIHVTPSARAPRAEELLIHPRCVLA
ncbi:hypothetical protein, partial [Enterobacter cloacae]|uniref:hypothetical protein n=1 Tax=Enterobacter cloacae TaxID=550 RepID=UPI0013D8D654